MSDDQFSQLQIQMTRLDRKFTHQMTSLQTQMVGLGSKFSRQMATMQTQIANLDKGLLKMFKYMTDRFDGIDKQLETKADKSTVNLMYNQLDSFLKRTDTDEIERAPLGHQVERHEGWIQQIAKTTGDKLTY